MHYLSDSYSEEESGIIYFCSDQYLLILKPAAGESCGEEVWEDCDDEPDFDFESADLTHAHHESASATSHSLNSLVLWLVGFLLQLQAKHKISDKSINLLFNFLHTFIRILGHFCGFAAAMVQWFPQTIYMLRKILPYSYQFTRFVVCPRCYKLWRMCCQEWLS